jgi:NADPH-dependent 2,4-dienoyl-CoA reductase/sulfur reductase-like enzyme
MRNIIIIGGSDAGISAAIRAIEIDPNISPTIIEADKFPNFSICGLPYYISHDVENWKNLAHRTVEEIKRIGIKLQLEHIAQSINIKTKQITITDKNGNSKIESYDKLIIATGGLSIKPNISGINNHGVFFLRWIPESIAIDEFIKNNKPKTAVIVGAGYIGMEMSEALMKRGIKVTIVEFLDSVLPSVDTDIGNKIRDMLIKNGIDVYNNISVESINKIGDKLIVEGSSNTKLTADMVLVSVGSIPNSGLGLSIGLGAGIKGALKVNQRMETGIQDVYAAGDCVETWHRILQKYTYIPLGTTAHKQGRIAGANAAGRDSEFAGTVGTQSVKIFNIVAARTGLNEKEAHQAGFQPISSDIETWDHKIYFPNAENIFIRVIADKKSKKLLGAQMLGAYRSEISKRIDIFATALFHGTAIDELNNYDLSYTPPLSSPWDPVQMAVQKIEKVLGA